MRLNWSSVSGASSYEVERKAIVQGRVPVAYVKVDGDRSMSYTDTEVPRGYRYVCRVRTLNEDGKSGWSEDSVRQ